MVILPVDHRKEKKSKTVNKNKLLTYILTLVINIAIVAYIAIKEFGRGGSNAQKIAMLDINMVYLAIAVICFAIAVWMETLKYHSMMMAAEGRCDLRGAFECAVLGKYYDNITPLGAGGQPFQIYYLKKRGLSTGTSAALPIVGFLTLQAAFIILAAVVFVFNGSVTEKVAAIRISAYIGLAFYMFIPICILLFAVFPKVFGGMVCAVAKFLSRLHIVKDYERTVKGIISSLDEYCDSLKLLSKRPQLIFKLVFFSLVYQMAIMSIPFFVLRAFGGTNGWWMVFSLVVFIYAAITIIPTPGNAGAAEGSFYAVFTALTSGFLFWAMLIWRILVYYSWLALGLIVISWGSVKHFNKSHIKKPIPQGPLNVAQFVDVFYPTIDGVVRTVDSYAARMNMEGNCCVICPRSTEHFEDNFSYEVLRTPALKLRGVSYLVPIPFFSRKLRSYFKSQHFDVFHTHSPFFIGRFAVMMGRKLGVPVVATFHSKYYDDVLDITHSRFIARIITNGIVKFYCKVDEVWACSAGTAQTLRSYGFNGEIKVMDNGVDICEMAPFETPARREDIPLELPADRRILLFVGQQIWQKNLRLILDVSKRLMQVNDSYVTVIAGHGYDGEEIKKYADGLDLGERVLFTGQIKDRELLCGLFSVSDLFFFPSIYDNAPLVVREAALMGLPSLLAAGSNSAEGISDGVNGFVANADCDSMADKIEKIFADGNLKQVGAKARETIPISWDEIVRCVKIEYRLLQKRSYAPVDIRQRDHEI